MLTVCTAEISSKIFWPEGPKIFGDQKICAGDQIFKLRSQLAPWIFFLKSSPAGPYIFAMMPLGSATD